MIRYDVKWEPILEEQFQKSCSQIVEIKIPQTRIVTVGQHTRNNKPLDEKKTEPNFENKKTQLLENTGCDLNAKTSENLFPIEDPRNPFYAEYLKLQQKYLESMSRKAPTPEVNIIDQCRTPKPMSRSGRVEDFEEEPTAKKDLGPKNVQGDLNEYRLEAGKENLGHAGNELHSQQP